MNRRDFPELVTGQGRVFWLLFGRVILKDGEPTYVPDTATNGSLPVSIGLPDGSITIESLDGGKTWSEVDDEQR